MTIQEQLVKTLQLLLPEDQPLELPRWPGTVIGSLRRERIYLGRTEDTQKKETRDDG